MSLEDKKTAAIFIQKWFRNRRKTLVKFELSLNISTDKVANLYVIVQKFKIPKVHYKYVIINLKNKRKSDDLLFIKALHLPRGLKEYDTDP
jgi:hypothetical protein